jgi:hypothetical protein
VEHIHGLLLRAYFPYQLYVLAVAAHNVEIYFHNQVLAVAALDGKIVLQ